MIETAASATTPAQDAFSRQAPSFDRSDGEEPMIQWVRDRVRTEALRWIAPGQRLLEINAGTGLDARFFAQHGVHVLATENAPGMLTQLRAKSAEQGMPRFDVSELDFHQMHSLAPSSFDMVFSNFGGINCTDRLGDVLRGIDHVLLPGGRCALVIMPRVSPWELIELFRGRIRYAFRRFHRGPVRARLEGVDFPCWYHSAAVVRRALPGFRLVSLMALSITVPPPHLGRFAARHPRFTGIMKRIERAIARWPLLRAWGDHFMIVIEKPVR